MGADDTGRVIAIADTDGQPLEAVWHGPGPEHTPTLVFLHEGLGSVSAWRDFPERLAKATGWGALVYSRRGYGGAAPLRVPRRASFLEDEARGSLPAVLRQAGVREYALVGHSDGASIALAFACDEHEGLRGLLLEAPHVFVEELCIESIARLGQAYRDSDLRERLERHHGANTEGAFWGWHDVWLLPEFRGWNIEERLRGITVPVLVIQGVDDEYGTVAQVRAIERQARGSVESMILQDCGHAPHRDQPERTLRTMVEFVQSLQE